MNKEQKTIAAIQKVVPDIMEWQDGVLVQFEWFGSSTDESGGEHFSPEPDEFETGIILGNEILGKSNGGNGQICCLDLEKKDFKNGIYEVGAENGIDVWEYMRGEIIGRPITIQDILKTRTDLAIDGIGGIFIRNHSDKEGKLWEMEYCGHYEIDKPFHLQSKETKELIGALILKK